MDAQTLTEKAFSASGVTSIRAFAAEVGVTHVTVLGWLDGSRTPSFEHAAVLAKMAGLPIVETASQVRMASADSPRLRGVLRQLAGGVALVLCAIGFAGAMPGKAYAARHADSWISGDARDNAYYVKGDWAWWARLVRWWLAWKLRGSRSTTWSPFACNAA